MRLYEIKAINMNGYKKISMASESGVYPPDEVTEEILWRLPVKVLLRFRCVSKSWRGLIGSERFVRIHHGRRTGNPSHAHHHMIRCVWSQGAVQQSLASLLSGLGGGGDPTRMGLALPESSVHGCHEGVVCVMDNRRRFHLWNPATRARHEMAALPEQAAVVARAMWMSMIGFGRDGASGAHKVLVTLQDRAGSRSRVYSSRMGSWKVVQYRAYGTVSAGNGHFASGGLRWHCFSQREQGQKREDCIVRVDLRRDGFERVEMPCDEAGSWWPGMGMVLGCLAVALMCEGGIDVWVGEEGKRWVKRVRVPNVGVSRGFCLPLWMGEEGELLIMCNNSSLVYYPRHNLRFTIQQTIGRHVYVESLVSI
ncbi:hypothetical protein OROMI_016159 [Orobanche minor]